MERTGYEGYSIERLMLIYHDENFRICKEDAATTKRLIKREMKRRMDKAFRILDENCGTKENAMNVTRFYENQFLTGRL